MTRTCHTGHESSNSGSIMHSKFTEGAIQSHLGSERDLPTYLEKVQDLCLEWPRGWDCRCGGRVRTWNLV